MVSKKNKADSQCKSKPDGLPERKQRSLRKQRRPRRNAATKLHGDIKGLVADALSSAAPDHDDAVFYMLVDVLTAKIEKTEAMLKEIQCQLGEIAPHVVRGIARLESRLQPVQLSTPKVTSLFSKEEGHPLSTVSNDSPTKTSAKSFSLSSKEEAPPLERNPKSSPTV
jgi:hypothetical protein